MNKRQYRGESDIVLLRQFNSVSIRTTGGCGYLHPGDITHHFFSGTKEFDHGELATVWEDVSGVAAWSLIGPRHRSADIQVRPDLRGGDFEREVLHHSEVRLGEIMTRHAIESDRILADSCRCDLDRSRLLLDLGWTVGTRAEYVLNRRSLVDIPEPIVPDGYRIRAVRGPDEALNVAELHTAAFPGAGWTEDLYRRAMDSSGYCAEHELVAEAEDASLAAFTVTWHDEVNRTGLFEPVGTHPEHRRMGLGRALMYTAMHRMASAGLEHAIVQNGGKNEGSRMLYRSCGFEPWQIQDGYYKLIG